MSLLETYTLLMWYFHPRHYHIMDLPRTVAEMDYLHISFGPLLPQRGTENLIREWYWKRQFEKRVNYTISMFGLSLLFPHKLAPTLLTQLPKRISSVSEHCEQYLPKMDLVCGSTLKINKDSLAFWCLKVLYSVWKITSTTFELSLILECLHVLEKNSKNLVSYGWLIWTDTAMHK